MNKHYIYSKEVLDVYYFLYFFNLIVKELFLNDFANFFFLFKKIYFKDLKITIHQYVKFFFTIFFNQLIILLPFVFFFLYID